MSTTRRQFIRSTALIVAVPAAATAVTARADNHLTLIDESDPSAVALGYLHDASKVDTTKFPKKAGPEGAKQLCLNCSLYQPKTETVGGCSIFPGKNVAAQGWCNVWAPKA